jgi:hypothetical protein
MKLSQHKKAGTALKGLKFLFAAFFIIFILIVFYVGVQKNISKKSVKQAEITTADLALKTFNSELIKKHGIKLASQDEDEAEDTIEEFAKNYVTLKGGFSADCDEENNDKECELTIKLEEGLSTVLDWSLFVSAAASVAAVPFAAPVTVTLVAIKLIAQQDLKDIVYESYLPEKPGEARKFTLKILVEYA